MSSSQDNAAVELAKDPSSPSLMATKAEAGGASNDDDEKEEEEHIFMDMNRGSFEEQCGFVLHVMIVLLSLYYTGWILSFYTCILPKLDGTIETKLHPWLLLSQQHHYTPPIWTILLPITIIVLFFLIPIIYGAVINRSVVVAASQNKHQALFTVQDPHTIRPLYGSPFMGVTFSNKSGSLSSSLCHNNDENINYYTNYYRDPMSWTPLHTSTLNDSNSTNSNSTTTVPDICDIDVADINDFLQLKYDLNGPIEKEAR